MKRISIQLLILSILLQYSHLYADPIIMLTVRAYPKANRKTLAEKMARKLHRSDKLAKYAIRKLQYDIDKKVPNGIFATYAGFLSLSNNLGQILFPKKQHDPSLMLIITNRAEPMLMAGNTVHHWLVPPTAPVKVYTVKRTTEENGDMYWHVKQTTLSKDNILPTNSILIFANPKNFFIPEGSTLTKLKNNFELPTIYARNSFNIATNALRVLMHRQFFDALQTEQNKSAKRLQQHILYG